METFIQTLLVLVDGIIGLVNAFLTLVTDLGSLLYAGGTGGLVLAFAAGTYYNIPNEILAIIRRWHGKIDERFANIDSLVTIIQAHSTWATPSVFSQVVSLRAQLSTLIPKCNSSQGSPADRGLRDMLLKSAVDLCLAQVKSWAIQQYYANIITLNDLHTLGFLLPGEASGHHSKSEPTSAIAEVKVLTSNSETIHVVIDHATYDNAALTKHGWPPGVRQAVIVIMAADGVTEVIRLMTTRLSNYITMPPGSRGKLFLIKAAFLKHIDDEPRFGPEPTFSISLTTEDLATGNKND